MIELVEEPYGLGVGQIESESEGFFVGYAQVIREYGLEVTGAALGDHSGLLVRLFRETVHTF